MQKICKTTGNTCLPRLSKRSLVFSLFILCFSVDTSRSKCVQIVTKGPRRFQRRNDAFPFNFWNNAADNKITVVLARFVDEVLQTKEGYRGTSKGPPVLAPFRSLSTPPPSWNSRRDNKLRPLAFLPAMRSYRCHCNWLVSPPLNLIISNRGQLPTRSTCTTYIGRGSNN